MNEIQKLAIKAAIEAGEAIMKIYQTDDFEITDKADNSPLTVADKAANKIIVQHLQQTEIPIISEEEKQTDFNIRKNWKQCWVVDPLDGTKEFIKRNGEFTVNIALVDNNLPVFGVIYVPASKELFVGDVAKQESKKAIVDGSTELEKLLKTATKLKPATKNPTHLSVVGSRSHMNEATQDFVSAQKSTYSEVDIVSKGSSLKFCLVAEGKADVYPRFAPTMEWDTAAGHAICKAVGVAVIDQKTGTEMRYNKANLLNNYFLVTKHG